MSATTKSLQQALDEVSDPIRLLRDNAARAYTFPVQPEFTNWRNEQAAWRDSCALLDQSQHMTDLFITGPDATAMLQHLSTNTAAGYQPGRARHFVATAPSGHVIGDGILFHHGENDFDLVGMWMPTDWVHYHCTTGEWDVEVVRDDNAYARGGAAPKLFRYELQGPTALAIVEKVTGAPAPELKFFHMGEVRIAGARVGVLRHGMAGQPGFEFWGEWADQPRVLEALLTAGEEFGITQAGSRAYSSANLANGWVPSPFPAFFGAELKGYREWLPLSRAGSTGGSFLPERVEDYYTTPFELGLERSVKFDHDFIGREALEAMDRDAQRKRVTLIWNEDDVAAIFRSQVDRQEGTLPAKFIELPKSRYSLYQTDRVLANGEDVGVSMDVGYLANERAFVSLATVAPEFAATGTEVTVIWGEDPVSRKGTVEPHRQVEVRATVAPAPFHDYARAGYRA